MVVGRAAGDGGAFRDVDLSLVGLINTIPLADVSFLLVEGVAEGIMVLASTGTSIKELGWR